MFVLQENQVNPIFHGKTMVSGRFPLKHPKDIQFVFFSIFMVRIMNPDDSSIFLMAEATSLQQVFHPT
jgi:hypothetical protein